MEERRAHSRVLVNSRAEVRVLPPGETAGVSDERLDCPVRDLSVGGVQLAVPQNLLPGTEVGIRVTCRRPRQRLDVNGRVAWVAVADSECRVGIFLVDNPKDVMNDWRRMVDGQAAAQRT